MEILSKILIVDDEEVGRDTLESLLIKEAYQLLFAKDGFEMLEVARENQPDLVLLDVMMPGMDGFEACEKLRKDPIIAETPVIMVTALNDTNIRIRGIEAGADDFISKPFNRLELRARIRTITRLNRYRILLNERSEKEIIKAQRDEILRQKKNIIDSINYAQRIQSAVFPPFETIKKIIPQHFILFKPKDIVSGDFYFVAEKDGKIVVAVADCTGHGIPGAFMSLLGLNILKDIMKVVENPESNIILDRLDEKIIHALNPSPGVKETKDGMDISLFVYDKKRRILQFSGARNALLIVKNNENQGDGSAELLVLKPDFFSVGVCSLEIEKRFSKQEILIQDKDTLYLFSDGYADQFGGPNDKKFSTKRMKKLIMSIHTYPLEDQKSALDESIGEWKGETEQTDDILVMGIKL